MGDWLKPTLTDLYSDFLDYIKQRDDDCRTFFQGVVSDVTFTDGGSGLNDLHVDGWPTADRHFVIEIDGTGNPDTFKWSKDGGTTWEATGVELDFHGVELSDGIYLGWSHTTGHAIGDRWEFTTKVPKNLPNRTVVFDRNSKAWKYWDSTRGQYIGLAVDWPGQVGGSPSYGILVDEARGLRKAEGYIVYPGSNEGDIPVNDGNLNTKLNADMVDNKHASSIPEAGKLLTLDSNAKFPNSVLYTGSGNGLDADKVDGYNASSTPIAHTLFPLDGSAKFPNSVLYTGSGNGLDADKVDGYDASTTPAPNKVPVSNSDGKLDNGWLNIDTSSLLGRNPDYDSGWIECGTDISRSTNQTYTYDHNLGTSLLFVLLVAHDKDRDQYLYVIGPNNSEADTNPIGFQWDSSKFYMRIYHGFYFLHYWGEGNNWVYTDNAEYRILAWKLL